MKTIAGYWGRLDGVERIFLAFLLFTQGYYFYRYAFRVQSELAPPGYEPTPDAFQYPKYIVAAAMLALLTVVFLSHRETARHVLGRLKCEPVWLLIIAFSLYCGLTALRFGTEPSDLSNFAKFLFVMPFALAAAVIWRTKNPVPFLLLFFGGSLLYHAVYEVVMFANFELTGRLPALTFSRLVPRYGAGWDDPNGFAAFAVMALLGLLFLRSSEPRWKVVQLALIAVLALLATMAYSMTAAGGLLVGLGLLLLARRLDVAKVAAMSLAVAAVAIGLLASGHIDIIVDGKLRSIQSHTQTKVAEPSPTVVAPSPTPASSPTEAPATSQPAPAAGQSQPPAPGQQQSSPPSSGQPPPQAAGNPGVVASADEASLPSDVVRVLVGPWDRVHFHETVYLLIYLNFGLLGLGLFIAIQAMTLRRALRQWRAGGEWADAYLLAAILLVVFLAMNLVLPLYAIFPVNLYVWLLIGLVWARPLPAAEIEAVAQIGLEPPPSPALVNS